ncbi:MAG: UDP-N-acetylmuramoyl-tripeptide--D-alanyl-D-alanine ligase [Polyangiaceae bacterium]|nr:UDP-N-acetylmuramoyl-tripeptide--D-alanyl-D-alanine ligase [Polyangiaceae bacterium]
MADVTAATVATSELFDSHFTGITTDSRGDLGGKLFVALRGERFDGHDYAEKALAQGALAVLAERGKWVTSDSRVFWVDDTLRALGALAAFHRKRWNGRVVAVAGSAGKTTTRSAITRLLKQLLPSESVWSPPGNLNNRIGVPMVLLGLTAQHHIAVVEIGTNMAGEVAMLTRIASPNVGVLTLIELEHTEGLIDLAGVEAEEGALFAELSPSGIAVGNLDDPRVERLLAGSHAIVKLGYGSGAADYAIVQREVLNASHTHVTLRRPHGVEPLGFRAALPGRAGALAAACAVAVAESTVGRSLSTSEVEAALGSAVGEAGRLCPIELKDGTLVIDDTYNSNPGSLISSLECAEELAAQRKARLLLVVGEMRELGALAESEHDRLGERLGASGAAYLLAIGGESRRFVEPARRRGMQADFVASSEHAVEKVNQELRGGDVVLVKASRGVRAELVVEGILQRIGRAT